MVKISKTFGKARKLVSLNPDKYKYLPLNMLVDNYGDYCFREGTLCESGVHIEDRKSFKEWLRSEI